MKKVFLLITLLSCMIMSGISQVAIPVSKAYQHGIGSPIAVSGQLPLDMKYMYSDTIHYAVRPFLGTAQALLYLPLNQRSKGLTAIVNIGGTLNTSTYDIDGGTDMEYWFYGGKADVNFVPKHDYARLANKPTIPVQFNPIAGTNMNLSGTYPNVTFNAAASTQVNSDWNSSSGVSQILNKPSIPAQFNPIAGSNMSLSGTYPNITFNSAGSGGSSFTVSNTGNIRDSGANGAGQHTLNYISNGLFTGGKNSGDSNFIVRNQDIIQNPLQLKALFSGYWKTDIKQGLVVNTTLLGGSEFSSYVSGTSNVYIKTAIDLGIVQAPTIGVQIGADTTWHTYQTVAGVNILQIAAGLDPTKQYVIRVKLRAINTNAAVWNNDNGFNVADIVVDNGGKCIPLAKGKKALFFGDSITGGENSTGTAGDVNSNNALNCYVQVIADSLREQYVQHGFGGTSFCNPSMAAGGVPIAMENIFNYFSGAPIDLREDVDRVFFNLGTNGGSCASIKQECDSLQSIIRKSKLYWPNARMIVIIPYYYLGFPLAVDTMSNMALANGCLVIGKHVSGLEMSDGLHPTVNGQIDMGNQLFADLKSQTQGTGSGGTVINNNYNDTILPIGSNAVDLHTYIHKGRYEQTSDTWAAAGTNYPEPTAGVLTVYNTIPGLVYHIYQTYKNDIYIESAYVGNWATFGGWHKLLKAGDPTSTVTVITNQDLYSLTTGIYAQNNDGFVSSSLNYPLGAVAGLVTIYVQGSLKYLLYQDYNGKCWVNGMLSGTYSGWKQLGGIDFSSLSGNFIPKYNGSSFSNSLLQDDGSTFVTQNHANPLYGGIKIVASTGMTLGLYSSTNTTGGAIQDWPANASIESNTGLVYDAFSGSHIWQYNRATIARMSNTTFDFLSLKQKYTPNAYSTGGYNLLVNNATTGMNEFLPASSLPPKTWAGAFDSNITSGTTTITVTHSDFGTTGYAVSLYGLSASFNTLGVGYVSNKTNTTFMVTFPIAATGAEVTFDWIARVYDAAP